MNAKETYKVMTDARENSERQRHLLEDKKLKKAQRKLPKLLKKVHRKIEKAARRGDGVLTLILHPIDWNFVGKFTNGWYDKLIYEALKEEGYDVEFLRGGLAIRWYRVK